MSIADGAADSEIAPVVIESGRSIRCDGISEHTFNIELKDAIDVGRIARDDMDVVGAIWNGDVPNRRRRRLDQMHERVVTEIGRVGGLSVAPVCVDVAVPAMIEAIAPIPIGEADVLEVTCRHRSYGVAGRVAGAGGEVDVKAEGWCGHRGCVGIIGSSAAVRPTDAVGVGGQSGEGDGSVTAACAGEGSHLGVISAVVG